MIQNKKPLRAVILAAGQGKRLGSEQVMLPKVLREVAGRPIIEHILEKLSFLAPEDVCIVTGFCHELVEERLGARYAYSLQKEQLGTGHAVMAAAEFFKDFDGDVLVLYGDMPLIRKDTYERLVAHQQSENCAACLLTCDTGENPPAYGRIIRDGEGRFLDIVEERDCDEAQREITEVNVGVYVFKARPLYESLSHLRSDNAQGEYYLTDVPRILLSRGYPVVPCAFSAADEILGVNTPEDLATCEALLAERNH